LLDFMGASDRKSQCCAFAPLEANMQKQSVSANILIQTMTAGDLALLATNLERVSITGKEVLITAGAQLEYCYFLESGIASIVARLGDTAATEIGICGREGMIGIAVLLGCDRSPHDTFMQVDGASALRIASQHLHTATETSASLRRLLLRYVNTFLVQSAHSTVSNAHHHLDARLARWLLMCLDRVDNEEIDLTHEFMAMMISAQRTGVTLALHNLEADGAIRSRRAKVVVIDREKLLKTAGDAYGTPEAEYRRLIAPFGRARPAPLDRPLGIAV
jgi:CRP-like cAMP-binding protein